MISEETKAACRAVYDTVKEELDGLNGVIDYLRSELEKLKEEVRSKSNQE